MNLLHRLQNLRAAYQKFSIVITLDFQRWSLWLIALMIVVALLQTLSIGSIVPMVLLLSDEKALDQTVWLQNLTGLNSPDELLLALAGVILFLSVTNNVLTTVLVFQQNLFANRFFAALGTRVLRGYLSQDYVFFLSQNSAVLLRNVVTETWVFCSGLVLYSLGLIANLIIVCFIVIALLIINPWLNGAAILLGGTVFGVFYLVLGKRLSRWGLARNEIMEDVNRHAHQALVGVRELKTLNSEAFFIQKYFEQISNYAKYSTRYQISSSIHIILIDLTLTIAITLVLAYTLISGKSFAEVINLIAPYAVIFVAALYRILPALSVILSAIMTIRYLIPAYETMYQALKIGQTLPLALEAGTPIRFEQKLALDSVFFRYPNNDKNALENISLCIQRGQKVAFIGESGAGKSTIVDLILGLLTPDKGVIQADDLSLSKSDHAAWRQLIGYVPQHIFLADMTLLENIAFGKNPNEIDLALVQTIIQRAGLQQVVENLPQGLNTPLGEHGTRLSGGERQRVGIARALYRQPAILVLDEATSALDSRIEQEILKDIFALGNQVTIIMISHQLSTVKDCDQIFFLEHGCLIAQGQYNELVSNVPQFARLTEI